MTFTATPTQTASGGQAARDGESETYARDRLRDGTPISIRHVTERDEPTLLRFMQQLSLESRRLRFFSPACDLQEAARWAAGADGTDHIGIVAVDAGGQILGHAACARMYGARAEVAIEVDEAHRHQGLATILITRLAREAEEKQIRHFVAEVLPDNHEMLAVFNDGFDASRQFGDGEVNVEFPTSAWQLPPGRFGHPRPTTTS
jgi:L-amino acid N-acyltransferase YncA